MAERIKPVVTRNPGMKICLVCSSGGHFQELLRLAGAWYGVEHFWVTFPGVDTDCLLAEEEMLPAYHPTNRNIWNLFRNTIVAWRILRARRPNIIISTGAGVTIPFFYLAKFFGIKTVYIESLTRIHGLSLTGKLVYPVADHFYVQWPKLARQLKKAVYGGQVL